MARPNRFPRTRRLSGNKAYARVFGGRHSAANRLLVVYAMPNDLPYPRLGLTVGRRCGGAVRRSKIKRLLREAFRLEGVSIPSGFDIVCVPKHGIIGDLDGYRTSLRSVVQRAIKRCEIASRSGTGETGA